MVLLWPFLINKKSEAFVIFCCHPRGSYSLQAGFSLSWLGLSLKKNHVSGPFEPETSGQNACVFSYQLDDDEPNLYMENCLFNIV